MRKFSKMCIYLIVIALLPYATSTAQTTKDSTSNKKNDSAWSCEIDEEMPMFPGGPAELKKYLKESIRYPQQAIDDKAEGKVIVGFVIYDDGMIGEAKIEKSVHDALDREALRIVNSMPRWSPGKMKGKPVKYKYRVPINFELPKATTNEKVFVDVEQMPMFPGGPAAMKEFIVKNTRYTAEMKKKGINGRVVVGFIVNEDGYISDTHVVKGIEPLFDQEALRVVRLMPRWVPGQQNGKKVKVRYNVPLKFMPASQNLPKVR